MHTKDPFSGSQGMYAELAVGLGETLASGNQPGVPYRLSTGAKGTIDANQVTVTSFASYSSAVEANGSRTIDYSEQLLSKDTDRLR
mmetsp:Transcript_47204/g.62503  ORF Transcript_47204/g.62503 Transcript_47204/m.62503 type:complete len:86 (+) Transcript_47204:468-725(+)